MHIKPILESHLYEISNIYIQIFNNNPWNEKWTKDIAYKRLKMFYDSDQFIGTYIETNNQIIGFLFGHKEYYSDSQIFLIDEIGVIKEYNNQKIGTKLIDNLISNLKIINISQMYAITTRDNSTNLFYEKNNFQIDNDTVLVKRII